MIPSTTQLPQYNINADFSNGRKMFCSRSVMKFLKMRLKIFFFFVFNSVVPCSDVGTDLATCIYLYQVSLYSLAPRPPLH